MGTKAVVSTAIGEAFIKPWSTRFLPTWLAYCDKHKLDLIVFLDFLDKSERARSRRPTWQKCLAVASKEASQYEQIAWIDSDIAINAISAPNIFSNVPIAKIGAVGLGALPYQSHLFTNEAQASAEHLHEAWASGGIRAAIQSTHRGGSRAASSPLERASLDALDFYKKLGFQCEVQDNFNSGVFVLSPEYHANLFRDIYERYEEIPAQRVTDNIPIVAEVSSRGLLFDLDSRFNVILYSELTHHYPYLIFVGQEYRDILFLASQTLFISSYFLHFAGTKLVADLFYPAASDWVSLLKLGGQAFPALYLDASTLDTATQARSYFSLVREVQKCNPVQPQLQGSIVRFECDKPRRVVGMKWDANTSHSGLHEREVDPASGVPFRWIGGNGASISFQVPDSEAENYVKYRGMARFLGDDDRPFLDSVQLMIQVNGYFPHTFTYKTTSEKSARYSVILFEGFAAIAATNTVALRGRAWTPLVARGSQDARLLSLPFVDLELELELFRL